MRLLCHKTTTQVQSCMQVYIHISKYKVINQSIYLRACIQWYANICMFLIQLHWHSCLRYKWDVWVVILGIHGCTFAVAHLQFHMQLRIHIDLHWSLHVYFWSHFKSLTFWHAEGQAGQATVVAYLVAYNVAFPISEKRHYRRNGPTRICRTSPYIVQ